MKLLIVTSLFAMLLQTCSEETISAQPNQNELVGEWVLKNVFLSDATDTPCGADAGTDVREVTVNFTTEKANESDMLLLNGQSVVNSFFGSYSITDFDAKTGTGILKMGGIGSTKMAGPTPLMRCETRYFTLLGDAADFKVITDVSPQQLHIGKFKKDTTPSRDGGTYLIFERKTK